ncbi:TIGR03943 family protein [Bacillus sp. JCM 19034]|uniref:TIGR03943 family putative permease subunit n=1 Tax=Bacillus sp. JCM 19034 TaxID=1481928 RepID=UPI00351D46E2
MVYIQVRQMIKAIVLLLFAVFIFHLHKSGEITRFINPNYLTFSQIASVLFLFLFFIQVPRIFTSPYDDHDHSLCGPWGCSHEESESGGTLKTFVAYGLIILPLFTGFLLPFKDFGAAEAQNRGVSYVTHDHSHGEELELNDQNKTVEEMVNKPVLTLTNDNFASYLTTITSYPQYFKGKEIELEGFILEEECHANSRAVITRFLVTHCVADAHAIGLVIEDGAALGIEENTWIYVKGELGITDSDEMFIPMINVKSWREIQVPTDPYIYP